MSDQQSEKWLPAGWTVELKVRENGKKDKCYIAPSSGLEFHSKAEVSRYLNGVQINHTKSKQKKKGTSGRLSRNVVVERVVAEGLPAGWIKEIRVKKKNTRTIRRDPYYTDPVSGYVFRSMKDVLRYLKTGELGRLACKPKDRLRNDMELEDTKVSSPAVPEREKLAGCRTRGQIVRDQSLNLNETVKDEQIIKSASFGECILLSQHTSEQRGEGTEMSGLNLPEAKDSEKIEGKSDVSKSDSALVPAVGTFPEEKLLENGVISANRKRKPKDKKERTLPHRSSKRLAGLEVDPTPELKTTNRARRIAARQSGEAETNKSEDFAVGSRVELFDQLEAERELNCTLHSSETTKVLESNNSKNPFEDSVTPEDYTGKVETENKVDEKQGCPDAMPPANQGIPEEQTGKEETDAKPGSSIVLPFGDSWPDPCIEFAVKTLTGAIPVGGDLDIQDYYFQQVGSSNQVDSGLTLPNVGVDNFCQTDLLCQQFDTVEKPAMKHQALAEQLLPHTGNVNLQNSGETDLHQHGEEKR